MSPVHRLLATACLALFLSGCCTPDRVHGTSVEDRLHESAKREQFYMKAEKDLYRAARDEKLTGPVYEEEKKKIDKQIKKEREYQWKLRGGETPGIEVDDDFVKAAKITAETVGRLLIGCFGGNPTPFYSSE